MKITKTTGCEHGAADSHSHICVKCHMRIRDGLSAEVAVLNDERNALLEIIGKTRMLLSFRSDPFSSDLCVSIDDQVMKALVKKEQP